jgi:hypothetical protein
MGTVRFGPVRKFKLAKLTGALLALNVAAFILGLGAALGFGRVQGLLISIVFGMTLLCGFSVAAYFLDLGRLYVYGLLAGFAPMIGEWLWRQGYASHHGIPITFGITAAIMIVVGLAVFLRFLRESPLPAQETL